jgi:hypothetical protein
MYRVFFLAKDVLQLQIPEDGGRSFSEMVCICKSTWRHNPEHHHRHVHRCKNTKYYMCNVFCEVLNLNKTVSDTAKRRLT